MRVVFGEPKRKSHGCDSSDDSAVVCTCIDDGPNEHSLANDRVRTEDETRLSALAVSEKRIREKRKGVERRGEESNRVESSGGKAKRALRSSRARSGGRRSADCAEPTTSQPQKSRPVESSRRRLSANSGTRRTAARTRRPADTRSAGRALPTPAAAARTPAATEFVIRNYCIT